MVDLNLWVMDSLSGLNDVWKDIFMEDFEDLDVLEEELFYVNLFVNDFEGFEDDVFCVSFFIVIDDFEFI